MDIVDDDKFDPDEVIAVCQAFKAPPPMTPGEKGDRKRAVKVRMMRMLEAKVKELDDVFGDMIDDLAGDLYIAPREDPEQDAKNFAEYVKLQEEVTEAAFKQFAWNLIGSEVWGLLSFHPEVGVELEFFSERPHTADGDRENWPKWFRLYEGNVDGGDSIIVDARGEGF